MHSLLNLMSTNEGEIPLSRYFEADMTFLWLKVPQVKYLVVMNLNELIDTRRKTKLPVIIGWNPGETCIQLVYQ